MNFNMNIIEPVGIRLKCNFAYQRRKKKNFYSREVGTNRTHLDLMKSRMKLANEDINRELPSMEEEHKKKKSARVCVFVLFPFFIENDNLAQKKKNKKTMEKK